MGDAVLEMKDISKTFSTVQVLRDVSFSLKRGAIHAIVGENGAGKSTLMKILMGIYSSDSGSILLNGKKVCFNNPSEAQANGIAMVHQEFGLFPNLSVFENILAGRLPKNRRGTVDWSQAREKATSILSSFDFPAGIDAKVEDLSVGERQVVEIAKALSYDPEVLVLDEPSSALSGAELKNLHSCMRVLRSKGISIAFISHRLEEIFNIADYVTILRDGAVIETLPVENANLSTLISKMVGKSLDEHYTRRDRSAMPVSEEVTLELKNVSYSNMVRNVDLKLHKGEILGVFGVLGAGKTELANVIFGTIPRKKFEGSIFINGVERQDSSPIASVAAGIGMVPEDRGNLGIVGTMNVAHNITLASLEDMCKNGFIIFKDEIEVVEKYVGELGIKTSSPKDSIRALSGGNQQKVVLAKWLCCGTRILLLDDPTRGIDVGAKAEIYKLISELSKGGISIIVFSSDAQEILGVADRIIVMKDGRFVKECAAGEASTVDLLHYGQAGNKR